MSAFAIRDSRIFWACALSLARRRWPGRHLATPACWLTWSSCLTMLLAWA